MKQVYEWQRDSDIPVAIRCLKSAELPFGQSFNHAQRLLQGSGYGEKEQIKGDTRNHLSNLLKLLCENTTR